MKFTMPCTSLLFLLSGLFSLSQNPSDDKTPSSLTAPDLGDEISDWSGVYLRDSAWRELYDVAPSRVRVKHGILHAFTYGTVPATAVVEYNSPHSQIRVTTDRPMICICHPHSLPAQPIIVKLHINKGSRLLNAGQLPVLGGKVAQARESDLIPISVHQPENMVWLVQARVELPPGEYALMLGTQNLEIFPFTVTQNPSKPRATASR